MSHRLTAVLPIDRSKGFPMAVQVKTKLEMHAALRSGIHEIIVLDETLTRQLLAVKYIKALGPVAVGAAVAAIPLVASSGGLAAVGLAAIAPGAAWTTSAIVALAVAFGGSLAVSLFTDWTYVDVPTGIKLRRNVPA